MVGRVVKFPNAASNSEERVQRLQGILQEIDYRGFRYTVQTMSDLNGESFISVRIEWPAPDRDDSAKDMRFAYSPFYCTGEEPERILINAVYDSIRAIEEHERAEMFKFRGKRVFDPHADLSKEENIGDQILHWWQQVLRLGRGG